MGTHNQAKNKNGYNYRSVLVFIFIAIYIIIPFLLTIWARTTMTVATPTESIAKSDLIINYNRIGIIGLIYLIAAFILPFVVFICLHFSFMKNVKSAIKDAIRIEPNIFWHDAIKDAVALNESDSIKAFAKIKPEIEKSLSTNNELKTAIEKAMNSDKVENAINDSLKDNNELINVVKAAIRPDGINIEAINNAITNALLKNRNLANAIKDALNAINANNTNNTNEKNGIIDIIKDALNNDRVKTVRNNALKEDIGKYQEVIEPGITVDLISEAVSDPQSSFARALKTAVEGFINNDIQINACLEGSLKKEQEAQKYRLAERIVSEICKNNKLGENAIAQIKNLVDGVLGFNQCCCLNITEDADKFIIEFSDVNCRKFRLFNYKISDKMYISSPNGTFTLSNGINIDIKGNMIQGIS